MTQWEQEVVDDGSSDETVEIARLWANADERICVLADMFRL
jgi:glycosyltransferase involved in cell wall biosynthesis